MKKFKELEPLVLDWAEERDLLGQDSLLQQSNRLRRDVGLMHDAIMVKSRGLKEFYNGANKIVKTEEEINKNLGKIFLDLIILAEINGVSLETCLEEAYKNRK